MLYCLKSESFISFHFKSIIPPSFTWCDAICSVLCIRWHKLVSVTVSMTMRISLKEKLREDSECRICATVASSKWFFLVFIVKQIYSFLQIDFRDTSRSWDKINSLDLGGYCPLICRSHEFFKIILNICFKVNVWVTFHLCEQVHSHLL